VYLASPDYNALVNAQADGIGAFKQYDQGPSFLHNPDHPEEDYNAVWNQVSELAVGSESSPYVNGQLANNILNKQVDLVRVGAKPPKQAMHDAAQAIDAEIKKKLDEDPVLRARWTAATGKQP